MTAIASTAVPQQPPADPVPGARRPSRRAIARDRGPVTDGEVTAAAWSHYGPALALAVGPVIWPAALLVIGIPLYFRLTVGKQSRYVRDQSTAALNFLATTLAGLGAVLGALLASGSAEELFVIAAVLAFFVLQIALLIRAGRAAKVGERYRYPFTIRILR